MRDVEAQSDGTVTMGPGTLYGTLQRLMDASLVEESEGPGDREDERRRYYRLTRSGRLALQTEVRRMEALVRAARAQRIIPRGSRG